MQAFVTWCIRAFVSELHAPLASASLAASTTAPVQCCVVLRWAVLSCVVDMSVLLELQAFCPKLCASNNIVTSHLAACLPACLLVRLSVCPSVCLLVCLSVCVVY